MNIPLLGLGSNQVDLGGIVLPLSATFIISSIVVAYIEKLTFISLSALFSNSLSPLIPPINSILSDFVGSLMPNMGFKRLFCSIDTSKLSIGLLSSKEPSFALKIHVYSLGLLAYYFLT